MKTLKIIIILLVFTRLNGYTQQSGNLKRIASSDISKAGGSNNIYIYNDNLDKFVGNWIGKKGGTTVKIMFIKKPFRLSKDPSNLSEVELITGTFQYFENETLIKSYTSAEIAASMQSKDTLNIFIDVKSRKAEAALLASFLQDGTIKLQIEQNRFEFKNDKDFELKEPIILSKQN